MCVLARKPNANKSRKVQPVLSAQFRRYLDQLVDLGYGKTPTDAARYLIDRGIDDMIRAKTIRTEFCEDYGCARKAGIVVD